MLHSGRLTALPEAALILQDMDATTLVDVACRARHVMHGLQMDEEAFSFILQAQAQQYGVRAAAAAGAGPKGRQAAAVSLAAAATADAGARAPYIAARRALLACAANARAWLETQQQTLVRALAVQAAVQRADRLCYLEQQLAEHDKQLLDLKLQLQELVQDRLLLCPPQQDVHVPPQQEVPAVLPHQEDVTLPRNAASLTHAVQGSWWSGPLLPAAQVAATAAASSGTSDQQGRTLALMGSSRPRDPRLARKHVPTAGCLELLPVPPVPRTAAFSSDAARVPAGASNTASDAAAVVQSAMREALTTSACRRGGISVDGGGGASTRHAAAADKQGVDVLRDKQCNSLAAAGKPCSRSNDW